MPKQSPLPTKRPILPLPPFPGPGRWVYAHDPMTGEIMQPPAGVESIPGHTRAPVRVPINRLPEYLAYHGLIVAKVVPCLGAETVLIAQPVSAETLPTNH